MKRLGSRKFCAALVIIAWVATLVSIWGMQEAGRRTVTPLKTCKPADLQGMGIQLEMSGSAAEALKILNGDPDRAACLRSGTAAQVRSDSLLIPAYGGLTLALFLFVRSFWITPPRRQRLVALALLILGIALTAAMVTGDVIENLQLTSMIDLAARNQPLPQDAFDRLVLMGRLKWGALAASAFLLALAWTSKSWRPLVLVLRLLGLAAAALFIFGLADSDWKIVNAGMGALAALWTAALIHSIAVAVEPNAGGTTKP